jgi:RNA polymerase sigma-32 factor
MDIPDELYPALFRYGSKAHEHSKLSREEVLELYRRCRDGKDEQARRYLARAHTRYAITIALKYCQYGLPLSALIAEGELGIVHALTKLDSERGHRFSTYVAYWIRARILNYVIHSLSSVEVVSGTSRSKLLFKLRREKVRIVNLLGEGSDTAEFFAQRFNGRGTRVLTATSANLSQPASDAAQ